MKLFFLVLARDDEHVYNKIKELESLGVPFLIVCGKKLDHPNIVYREPRGKYDAINFGAELIPEDIDVVALNDVDTKIDNLGAALRCFNSTGVDLVFARVSVEGGPQKRFYKLLDFIRRRVPITSSGELMLVRRSAFDRAMPLKPCKAEDSYILFKILEQKGKVVFCEACSTLTKRTNIDREEESYKRRTVAGIYQALRYSNPPLIIKLFYLLLPFISPLLLVQGKKGYYWMKGILYGLVDFLKGDETGIWGPTYAMK